VMSLRVYDVVRKRALVTRQSARAVGDALAAALESPRGEVVLDFSGIDAVTPSFVDEALGSIEEMLGKSRRNQLRVVFVNPPTRLSAKFAAIGRARGLEIKESDNGVWVITASTLRQPVGGVNQGGGSSGVGLKRGRPSRRRGRGLG
jgi:hypothetical protein